jgi:hypothetical protein
MQGKIYFCRRVHTRQGLGSKHTKQEVRSVFISNVSLPLTLMDGFGFTIFAIAYLEKGAYG